jgi:hypothetical protein
MIITKTVYNLLDFYEGIATRPDYKNVKSLFQKNGHMVFNFEELPCKVFNPELAVLFRQTSITGKKTTITNEVNLHEGRTVLNDTKQVEEQFSILPLLESYCSGYNKGRTEMEKRYPNPAAASKDLKIIFDKELRRIPYGYSFVTSTANMAKIGHQAGRYSIVLDWAEQYPESLKDIATRPENKPEKVLPSLRDIFTDKDYFNTVLYRIESNGICSKNRDTGQYHWEKSLNLLGGFAYKLKNQHRINYSGSNQELGLVFCQFFNVELSNNKAFQPKQSKEQAHHFNWITNFSE